MFSIVKLVVMISVSHRLMIYCDVSFNMEDVLRNIHSYGIKNAIFTCKTFGQISWELGVFNNYAHPFFNVSKLTCLLAQKMF